MKLFKLFFFLSLAQMLFPQHNGFTPSLPVQNTDIYRKSNIYQQDFLYLCEGLISFHANVFMNFAKEEFEKQKEDCFNKLKECKNENEFGIIAKGFICRVKDGHTGIGINATAATNKIYPFRCKYLVDSLVIMAVSDQLPFNLCGERIKSINGINIKDIEKKDRLVFTTENYVSSQNGIMLRINSTEYLKALDIIHSDSESVSVATYSGKEFVAKPDFNGNWKSNIPVSPSLNEKKSEPFFYRIDKEKEICYLQFNQMIDRRIGDKYLDALPFWKRWLAKTVRFFGVNIGLPKTCFDDFLNSCISDMEKNGIKKVVVDLRWNTGGNSSLGDLLLYALGVDKYKSFSSEIKYSELYKLQMGAYGVDTTKPVIKDTTEEIFYTKWAYGADNIKSRFKGDAYFITSEWTFSSAVMLAIIVKDNKLFKVVGEPISERPSHFGEVLCLKLPNTKLNCSLSCKLFHRPDKSKDNEETMYPDKIIYKTYDDIINGIDRVYEWVAMQ